MNILNMVIVGLVSGLVTVGVAYFILAKLADFHWWWLITLFGAPFLSVILVAYVLERNFGCGVKAAVPSSKQVVDWSSLRKTTIDAPSKITPQIVPDNSADWQDLLQQLDQMSKAPAVVAEVKTPISAAAVCPPVTLISPVQPASTPVASSFDFSAIANALSISPPVVAVSDRVQAATNTAVPSSTSIAPLPIPSQVQTAQVTQGIDFASLFK